jgi:hypothetical protein
MDAARYHARLAAGLGEPAPIGYQHGDVRLAFTPTGLAWSGSGYRRPRARVRPVGGRLITAAGRSTVRRVDLAGRGLIYEDAFGDGLHLGV